MDKIMSLVHWFTNKENIEGLLAIIGGFYTLALTIVKITPSQADDEILDKIYQVIHKLIGSTGIKK